MRSIYIIMGVSGSGKSTIGLALSKALNIRFVEGDEYHPQKNIDKMASGVSLTNEDRIPWLYQLRDIIQQAQQEEKSLVLACSALTEEARNILLIDDNVVLIHLVGSKELIAQRLRHRAQHFMPVSLLDSQFNTLQWPSDAIQVDIDNNIDEIVDTICLKVLRK